MSGFKKTAIVSSLGVLTSKDEKKEAKANSDKDAKAEQDKK